MNNIALIFAGGSGTRMKSTAKPKQFLQFLIMVFGSLGKVFYMGLFAAYMD